MRKINDNKGITLIEVIAAIVIISIIFISFFGLFLQSKKTNVSSEGIHDATYVAQKEMENIYISTRTDTLQQFINSKSASEIKSCTQPINEKLHCIEPTPTVNGFKSEVTISSITGYSSNVTRILIEVYDTKDNIKKAKAIMENVYIWKK